jgi:dUTP pyrophosphatase
MEMKTAATIQQQQPKCIVTKEDIEALGKQNVIVKHALDYNRIYNQYSWEELLSIMVKDLVEYNSKLTHAFVQQTKAKATYYGPPTRVHLKVEKIHPEAVIESYAHDGDSGLDLYAVEEVVLEPNTPTLVPTGLKIEIPYGYEGQIRPKSGLALNNNITVANTPGTIDSNYRGEVKVIALNQGLLSYVVKPHTKIAQLVICPVAYAQIEEVHGLSETSRGGNGFGSTGLTFQSILGRQNSCYHLTVKET